MINELVNVPKSNRFRKIQEIMIDNGIDQLFFDLRQKLLSPNNFAQSEKKSNFSEEMKKEEKLCRIILGLDDEKSLENEDQPKVVLAALELGKRENRQEITVISVDFEKHVKKILDNIKYEADQIPSKEEAEEFEEMGLKSLINLVNWFKTWSEFIETPNIILKVNLGFIFENFIQQQKKEIDFNRRNRITELGNDKLSRLFFFFRVSNTDTKQSQKMEKNFEQDMEAKTAENFAIAKGKIYRTLLEGNFGDNLIDLGRNLTNTPDLGKVSRYCRLSEKEQFKERLIRKLCENPSYNLESDISLVRKSSEESEVDLAKLELKNAGEKMNDSSILLNKSIEIFYEEVEKQKQKMSDPDEKDELEMGSLLTLLGFIGSFEDWIKGVETEKLALKMKMEIYIDSLSKKLVEKISVIKERVDSYPEVEESEIKQFKPDPTNRARKSKKRDSCVIS